MHAAIFIAIVLIIHSLVEVNSTVGVILLYFIYVYLINMNRKSDSNKFKETIPRRVLKTMETQKSYYIGGTYALSAYRLEGFIDHHIDIYIPLIQNDDFDHCIKVLLQSPDKITNDISALNEYTEEKRRELFFDKRIDMVAILRCDFADEIRLHGVRVTTEEEKTFTTIMWSILPYPTKVLMKADFNQDGNHRFIYEVPTQDEKLIKMKKIPAKEIAKERERFWTERGWEILIG